MDPAVLWCESLMTAYALARGERLNELRGVYVRRFDAQGMHPFSAAWGGVQAAERLDPDLNNEAISTSPRALWNVAREDADAEFRAESRDALRLLAGGWYLDAASDTNYADLFERGWLAFNNPDAPEPGDYHLTPDGQGVIDAALEKMA